MYLKMRKINESNNKTESINELMNESLSISLFVKGFKL